MARKKMAVKDKEEIQQAAAEAEDAPNVPAATATEAREKSKAEIDAEVLIEAERIRRDPKRFMAARSVNPSIQS